MGESNNQNGGSAHGDAWPNGGDGDIEIVEQASYDWHDSEVVNECPEQVDVNKLIAPVEQVDKRYDFIQVLRQ